VGGPADLQGGAPYCFIWCPPIEGIRAGGPPLYQGGPAAPVGPPDVTGLHHSLVLNQIGFFLDYKFWSEEKLLNVD